jgi:hypothetical protein
MWAICVEARRMPVLSGFAFIGQKAGNPFIACFSMDWIGCVSVKGLTRKKSLRAENVHKSTLL